MRKLLLIFFALPLFSFAQFTDNFSDGDFTNNPEWSGNDSSFVIANNLLRSNGPQASSTIFLSTGNTLIDSTEWNFLVRLDFNPSSTNLVRIYLVSDQADLSGSLNGYFVQFGEAGTAPDSLDIFKQSGSAVTKIFTGVSGIMTSSSSNSVRVRVVRHADGTWDVFADKTGGTNLTFEGSFTDNSITTTSYFGVACSYSTASRYNLYYFDDFSVSNILVDTIKPTVQSVNVFSTTTIDVKFSETVEVSSAQAVANYSVDNLIGNPSSAALDASDSSLVHLTFAVPFTNATNYVLTISNVNDLSNNTMNVFTFPFSFFNAQMYDVQINEIMADPDPVVGLNSAEYVELYNRTAFPISLNGWQFSDATSSATLPNITIQPDSFLVLCATANLDSFPANIAKVGVASLPSLNNAGDSLSLKDNYNNIIHRVNYSDTWYQNSTKKNGGWSLEMIDANNTCSNADNWIASNDPNGGTPGRRNSVAGENLDVTLPQLVNAVLQDSNTVILSFSEALDSSSAATVANYVVNNSMGIPVSATPVLPNYTSVELVFNQNFSTGILYTIKVSNVSDVCGNPIGINDTARFAVPDIAQPNDVIINEILFNPKTGGYDFVELYNRSEKIIDLSQFDILEKDIEDPETILEETKISAQSYLLFPKEFVVLTANADNIQQNYYVENPNALLIVPRFPNYPDNKGICVLKIHEGETIDSLVYDQKWHFALLDDKNGVSLERVDYDKPTQEKTNWHSAASTVGYATPTYRNSQFSETGITDDEIEISPEVFTPDNDGDNDYTNIKYRFTEPGYVMNAKVYDIRGREIRTLVRSELLAAEGTLQWDGVDDDNQKARVGIYIIYLEIFNLEGKVKKFKKEVTLGAKLN